MQREMRKHAGRPAGVGRDETRVRIVEAGCRCFAAQGYANTSNQDIARRAGVTTGALYHYFASKADIFAAVHRHVHQVLLDVYRRAFAEQKSCVAQLCAGLEASLALHRSQPHLIHFAAIAALEIQRHPELSALLDDDQEEIRGFFTQLIAAGHARGEIPASIPTAAVVNLVISSLFGLAWLQSKVDRPEEYEAAVRAFQNLLRGALFRV